MSLNVENNIHLSKVNDLKNDWIISNSEITYLLKDNLQTVKTFTKLSDAILFVDKQDTKNINIVAHGYPGFIELGSGYSTESLEKELNDISEYTDFDQTTFNLWSCFGGSENGIAQSIEKSLRTKVNSSNGKLGKGQSLELDENNKFQNEIANLPTYLHTNSVGFDVIDNGNGTFGLVVYYGTWHGWGRGESQSTESALSLYTLATGGDVTDSDDYTVEAYGQGGAISNQTNYFTNPPKNTGNITFTTADFNTEQTTFIEGQSGNGTTDLTDRGFTPGTNLFFAKRSDTSTLYSYNSTDGTSLASGFKGVYGYQSAYISTVSPGTYRAYYDGVGSWDSTDPLNAPPITVVFEPIDAIKTALITIDGSGDITVGEPPRVLINSVDGDNGASSTDFVTSGRGVAVRGTYDTSTTLPLISDTLTVDVLNTSTGLTTQYITSSSELTASNGEWVLSLTTDLDPASYTITSKINTASDGTGTEYSNNQTLSIVAGSLEGISSDNGISSRDLITTDNTLIINGIYSSSTTSSILISIADSSGNKIVSSQAPTSTNGDNWYYDLTSTSLNLSTYTVTANIVDNAGSFSINRNFQIIDGPDAPLVTAIDSDTDTAGDFVTTDTTLTISGTFNTTDDPSNSNTDGKLQVTVAGVTYSDGGTNNLVTDYSAGTWSITPSSAFSIGTYAVLAEITDPNGNYNFSSQSILVADASDTTAPTAPTITSIETDIGNADFSTSDSSLIINGTFDASDFAGGFNVSFGGNTYTLGTDTELVANGNSWALTYPNIATTGNVVATARDSGGNESSATQSITIVSTVSTPSTSDIDPLIYIASNSDLITSFGLDTTAATQHYLSTGYLESRNLDSFNAFDYMAGHSDLLSAFGTNTTSAIEHYINFGYAEGRVKDNFDEWSYIASHTDLIAAFGTYSQVASLGTQHYVNHGHSENRVKDNFDELSYIASHTDLISAFGSHSEAESLGTQHYVKHGHSENRVKDNFDELSYLASHTDLINAFGRDTQAATKHYLSFGYSENRSTDSFDATSYIKNYSALAKTVGYNDDFAKKHFVEYGFNEGRIF